MHSSPEFVITRLPMCHHPQTTCSNKVYQERQRKACGGTDRIPRAISAYCTCVRMSV